MYIHTSTCVCESQRRFFSLLSLKYITYSFSFRPSLLPAAVLLLSLLPPFPPLVLRSSCLLCVPWLPCVSCCVPFRLPVPVPCSVLSSVCAPLKLYRRPSVCPAVCRAACPSLVSRQAQNGVTVWADAPRVCPRPYLLLPMCCRCSFRVSSCPFRCLFRGLSCLLSSVRVCVLLPAVLWR